MQQKSLFTIAALSAICLLPMGGAFAQDTNRTADSVMDAGQFRDSLHKVHDLFSRIQENHNLSLASQDSLIASQYQDENRRLLVEALGILDAVSATWKQSGVPSIEGETAEMRSQRTINRLGTADALRYATESDDTAFVRNTVWELRNMLNADKLNGRDPIVSKKMVSMLDAAISRSESPSFRTAWIPMNRERLAQNIEFSRREEAIVNTPSRTETVIEAPATQETTVETTTEETTPAPASAVEETTTTTEERAGAANLPQTGGDPGMLVLFGSSLMGVGALLRRRK